LKKLANFVNDKFGSAIFLERAKFLKSIVNLKGGLTQVTIKMVSGEFWGLGVEEALYPSRL
jgi:hypothetical protein